DVYAVLKKVLADFPREVTQVTEKTHENKLKISMISSQMHADKTDYLKSETYSTGVRYGNSEMERIHREMRPTKDEVIIKDSGMHAVEDHLMSRYQMYWQIYFHPVSRGGEVLLNLALRRAKYLHEEGYVFKQAPKYFIPFFDG